MDKNECYAEHSYNCTVAKFSPNGCYIASGDVSGKVRIWDATQPTHLLKAEYQILSGQVKDIAWDFEGNHLIVAGEGRDRFAHAFMFDTGSSVGEIIGSTKTINSVSITPCRPYRAVTASDDFTVKFYQGTPYKFAKSFKDHKRFAQCVRYSPDGKYFASCGSDGKVFLYHGESGDLVGELKDGDSAHSSGILSLAWSSDSKQLATASMNQKVKVWTVESLCIDKEYSIKLCKDVHANQIVGCHWAKQGIIALTLSGNLVLLDISTGDVKKVFEGHQKGISALTVTSDESIISASYDGSICEWKADQTCVSLTKDKPCRPQNQIDDICIQDHGDIFFATPLENQSYQMNKEGIFDTSRKHCFAFARLSTGLIGLSEKSLTLWNGDVQRYFLDNFPSKPRSMASSLDSDIVAVGFEDKSIKVYSKELLEIETLTANPGAVCALSFSIDGKWLAAGDDQRRIKIYRTTTWEPSKTNWCFHNAKISCLTWINGSEYLISGAIDNNIMVWSPSSPIKPICTIQSTHEGSRCELF